MNTDYSAKRNAFVVFGFVLLLAACSRQDGADRQPVSGAVDEIWKQYSSSLNSGDLDTWMSLWTEDGVQMPPGEPAVSGKDQIRSRNKAVLDRFTFDMGITNQEVEVAGDWAFARGTYKATLTPKEEGGEIVHIDGKYMTILQKQPDGSWRIHRDIFNSNVG